MQLKRLRSTKLYRIVLKYFEGDKVKADLWFKVPNPELYNLPPMSFMNTKYIRKHLTNRIMASVEDSILRRDYDLKV